MKCNETQGKWCKNKHGASKIIDTFETYQSPLPAMIHSHGPPLNHGEHITLWLRDFELPQRNRIKASSLEVEIAPPCWHWIIEASLLRAWMRSESIGSPQSSLVLQEVAGGPPFSIPPWIGGRGDWFVAWKNSPSKTGSGDYIPAQMLPMET
jgi:hypothetical protein